MATIVSNDVNTFTELDHEFYGVPEFQTPWDSFNTADEIFYGLIEPAMPRVAVVSRQLVAARAMGNFFHLDLWQDIAQEASLILFRNACTKLKQEPKDDGFRWVPATHINNAVIDASRRVLGCVYKGGGGWVNTFANTDASLTVVAAGTRTRTVAAGESQNGAERLRSTLVEAGFKTAADFSEGEIDALIESPRSRHMPTEFKTPRVRALRLEIKNKGVEFMREVLKRTEPASFVVEEGDVK